MRKQPKTDLVYRVAAASITAIVLWLIMFIFQMAIGFDDMQAAAMFDSVIVFAAWLVILVA